MKDFFQTAILGGLKVILPLYVMVILFYWVIRKAAEIIHPLTDLIMRIMSLPGVLADIIAFLAVLAICFVVGLLVKTKSVSFLYKNLADRILMLMPGYPWFKETVSVLGRMKKISRPVILANVYGGKGVSIGYITEEGPGGVVAVFPYAFNFSSASLFILKEGDFIRTEETIGGLARIFLYLGIGSGKFLAMCLKHRGAIDN